MSDRGAINAAPDAAVTRSKTAGIFMVVEGSLYVGRCVKARLSPGSASADNNGVQDEKPRSLCFTVPHQLKNYLSRSLFFFGKNSERYP